jgi:hypothetical protein
MSGFFWSGEEEVLIMVVRLSNLGSDPKKL